MSNKATITYLEHNTLFDSRNTSGDVGVYMLRAELSLILDVYGRMVANGIWKDYALSPQKTHAIFAIYRRAAEHPLYKIIKEPALDKKQGMWRIEGPQGNILKRGKDLANLLKYFDRLLLRTI